MIARTVTTRGGVWRCRPRPPRRRPPRDRQPGRTRGTRSTSRSDRAVAGGGSAEERLGRPGCQGCPARLGLTHRNGEALTERNQPLGFDDEALVGEDGISRPNGAVDQVERGVRAGGVVRIAERVRVAHDERGECDRDAEQHHEPPRGNPGREPASEHVVRRWRVSRGAARLSAPRRRGAASPSPRPASCARGAGAIPRRARRPAIRPRATVLEALERLLDRGGVVRRGDDPGACLPDQLGCGAVRRHRGEDRTADGDVLEHLPREDTPPTPARVGDEQEQRLGVALERERGRPRRVREELEPVSEPERPAHSRSAGRKSPRKRATTSSSESAAPGERARIARPKKLPVW